MIHFVSSFLSLGSYLHVSAQVDNNSSGGTMMGSYTFLADAFITLIPGHTGTITINHFRKYYRACSWSNFERK